MPTSAATSVVRGRLRHSERALRGDPRHGGSKRFERTWRVGHQWAKYLFSQQGPEKPEKPEKWVQRNLRRPCQLSRFLPPPLSADTRIGRDGRLPIIAEGVERA